MLLIEDLGSCQCRYALTDPKEANHYPIAGGRPSYPHLFCGAATAGHKEPYCPQHKALCHRGHGKDARSLEEMIYAIDTSQIRIKRQPDTTAGIDDTLRRQGTPKSRRFSDFGFVGTGVSPHGYKRKSQVLRARA